MKPGVKQKGERWQNLAGSCTDPSVQLQASGNLLSGVQANFGQNMGLLKSNVKITCGKTGRKREAINSDR